MKFLLITVFTVLTNIGVAAAASHNSHGGGHGGGSSSGSQSSSQGTEASVNVQVGYMADMWMLEYRYMRMNMAGLLDGTKKVAKGDVSGTNTAMNAPGTGKDYMWEPANMTMDMHMFMAMYDVTEQWSLMAMVNYLRNEGEMFMQMQAGPTFDEMRMEPMKSSGFGDLILAASYKVIPTLSASLGVSYPTGSIDETGVMMEGDSAERLPYGMQLGSGSYDLIPAFSYHDQRGPVAWNALGSFTYRTGDNDNDYRLGNKLEMSAGLDYQVNANGLITTRLAYTMWGKVRGQDPQLDPMDSPEADPEAQGGVRLDALIGISTHVSEAFTVGVDYGTPIYQKLNGPQLKLTSMISLGFKYMWM